MNNKLLQNINDKLKDKPLFFFSGDVERAIGLENHLQNFHIACIRDNYIVDQLLEHNKSVFCVEREISEYNGNTTASMLENPKLRKWIDEITHGGEFYAITFFPSSSFKFKVEKIGGTYIGNNHDFYKLFENKLKSKKLFEDNNIPTPKSELKTIDENSKYEKFFNADKYIVQTQKSHTGNGTFVVDSADSFNKIKEKIAGNEVKVSEFLDGVTLTMNGCIAFEKCYYGPIQIQIQNEDPELGSFGTTLGNEFGAKSVLDNYDDLANKTEELIEKITKMLIDHEYKGLFGIDFMYENGQVYLFEINARQTANMPFQTQLEVFKNFLPLSLVNLAQALGIEEEYKYRNLNTDIIGAQVFIRADKKNFHVNGNLKSGKYIYRGDTASIADHEQMEIKEHSILLDENGDKTLVFIDEGYRIDHNNHKLVCNFSKKGTVKKYLYDEIARIQSSSSLYKTKTGLPQWLKEAIPEIRNLLR